MVHSLREESNPSDASEEERVMICLIKAYFSNICKLSSNGCYVPINLLNEEGSNEGNIDVYLHQDSILRFTSIVCFDLMCWIATFLGPLQGYSTHGRHLYSGRGCGQSTVGYRFSSAVVQVRMNVFCDVDRYRVWNKHLDHNCLDPSYHQRYLKKECLWILTSWVWKINCVMFSVFNKCLSNKQLTWKI